MIVAGLIVRHALSPTTRTGEVSFLVVGSGAAMAAWWAVARARHRRTPALIAAGVTLSAIGDLIWQVLAWSNEQVPEVSIADAFWVGAYVSIGAALLTDRRRAGPERRRLDRDGLLDVGVVALLAMVAQWELALRDLVADDSIPIVSRLVWALYPACDAIVLALVVRAMVRRRLVGLAGWSIAAGTISWLAADYAFSLFQLDDKFVPWMDTLWLTGAALFGAATWKMARPNPARPVSERAAGASYGSILVALVPLIVPGGVAVLQSYRGQTSDPPLLYGATLVLLAVSVARAFRLLRAERHAREALVTQERFASAIAINSSDAVMVLASDGTVLVDSPQLAILMGEPAAVGGGNSLRLIAHDDRDRALAIFASCIATPGRTFDVELRVAAGEGSRRWVGARLVNLLDDPDVRGVVVNLHDITDRKRAQEQLEHLAFHDALTGLANRALFVDRVEQALRRAARSSLGTAVLFLDLDGFKTVNDCLGHGAGDDLLIEVGRRLVLAVGDSGSVARLGGDEFAVLIEQSSRPLADSEDVARRVLGALDTTIGIDAETITISASIGIAVVGHEEHVTASSVLRDADVAMYRAKASGRARWVVHDPAMRMAAAERLRLESDLGRALAGREFRLVYQPVVQLATGRVVGFEALIRWHHPTLGLLGPDRFIPIAEENGQIVAIGSWALREACVTLASWQRAYPAASTLTMAVNLSARQLASDTLTGDVADAIRRAGIAPGSLVLEMTETMLVQDADAASRRLTELRDLGVRLAIDDFGTGYSSLSYLRQFPVDILKIDRSFVETIQRAGDVPAIVVGLVDLGRTLELELIAEGVELAVQRDELFQRGCELAQGYLFSKPLPQIEAELLLLQQSAPVGVDDARRPSH